MDVYGHYTLENLKSSAKITEQTSHNRNMNCYNRAKKLLVTININKADNKTLCQLPGIGHKKASAIIAYRQQHGKFKSVKDLLNIKGVNDKLIDKLKPHIVLTP